MYHSGHLAIKSRLEGSEQHNRFLSTNILEAGAGTLPLSDAICSLAAVRCLVCSVSRMQQISQAFFDEHLRRVNNLRPSQLLDKKYRYNSAKYVDGSQMPKARPYQVAIYGHDDRESRPTNGNET